MTKQIKQHISEPKGQLAIKTVAMPCDTNGYGDIFGGWILGQMDLAGSILAVQTAQGRVATIAIESMQFHLPTFVGDVVSFYVELDKVGNTSMRIKVETWILRHGYDDLIKVTEGYFIYVALDSNRRPRPVFAKKH